MYKTKNIINSVLIQNNCQKINIISLIESNKILNNICPATYNVFRFCDEQQACSEVNDYATLPPNDPMTNITHHCVIYDFTNLKKAYYCKQLSAALSIPSIAIYPDDIGDEIKRRYSIELENLKASVNVFKSEDEKEWWGFLIIPLAGIYFIKNEIIKIIK